MSEKELVEQIKQKNQAAFAQLVSNYQVSVIRISIGIVHHRVDAEDIAQDVFVEIWNSISLFKEQSKLSTWIYRITMNKSLNFLRNNKKRKFTIFNTENFESVKMSNIEEFCIENKEKEFEFRAKILDRAIDKLPENQKKVFVFSKFEDMAYKEISEITGFSISSVESLIHRAKVNLQKYLLELNLKN